MMPREAGPNASSRVERGMVPDAGFSTCAGCGREGKNTILQLF